jgi:hypothetical protein
VRAAGYAAWMIQHDLRKARSRLQAGAAPSAIVDNHSCQERVVAGCEYEPAGTVNEGEQPSLKPHYEDAARELPAGCACS